MSCNLDDDVIVVGELRWRGIGVPFDICRYQLDGLLIQHRKNSFELATYMGRHEDAKGSSLSKKAVLVDRRDNSVDLDCGLDRCQSRPQWEGLIYRFTLERPPHHGSIPDSEFGEPTAGEDTSLGDLEGIHDGDYIVTSGASTLDILEQLASN